METTTTVQPASPAPASPVATPQANGTAPLARVKRAVSSVPAAPRKRANVQAPAVIDVNNRNSKGVYTNIFATLPDAKGKPVDVPVKSISTAFQYDASGLPVTMTVRVAGFGAEVLPLNAGTADALGKLLRAANIRVSGGGNAPGYGTPEDIARRLTPVACGGVVIGGVKGVQRASTNAVVHGSLSALASASPRSAQIKARASAAIATARAARIAKTTPANATK